MAVGTDGLGLSEV